MSDFELYHYRESDVDALPLTVDNQAAILARLKADLVSGELSYLDLKLASKAETYTINFRYKNQTTIQTLSANDYFVIKPLTGIFVIAKDTFEGLYELFSESESTNPRADYTRLRE